MRLYLATVAADDLRWATEAGLCDGVVATPAVLAAELPQADPREVVGELAERTALPIFAGVPSLDAAEIARGGKALARIAEHVIVAIPFVEDALPAFRDALEPGGALAVITYNSGEDRLVKLAFREWASACVCPPHQPVCTCRGRPLGQVEPRKPITPTEDEIAANPRARSAKLRIFRVEHAA